MNDKGQKIAVAIMATLSTTALTVTTNAFSAEPKCFGIAKAGKNACGAPSHEVNGVMVKGHACAGQATVSFSCYEWLPIPAAQCTKLIVTDKGKNYSGFTSIQACLKARGQAKPTCPTIAMEKCYGILKGGKPYEWIKLPKGTCLKIVGGSLTPQVSPK